MRGWFRGWFRSRIWKRHLQEIKSEILKAPQQSLRLAKRCIDRGVELDPKGALETEIAAIEEQLAAGSWMGKK